jgi:hypothetical protein
MFGFSSRGEKKDESDSPATFAQVETVLGDAEEKAKQESKQGTPNHSYTSVETLPEKKLGQDDLLMLDPRSMAAMADNIAEQVAERIRSDEANAKEFHYHYDGDGPHEYEIESSDESNGVFTLDFKVAVPMDVSSRVATGCSKKVRASFLPVIRVS